MRAMVAGLMIVTVAMRVGMPMIIMRVSMAVVIVAVIVRVFMALVMRMRVRTMIVPMRMPMIMAMRVAMMMMRMPAHREHAKQIDSKAQRADKKQLVRVHLWRFQDALDRLEDDEYGDEDEEDPIGEAGQRLNPRVPVSKPLIGLPRGHDGRKEPDANCHAVKGHMNSIRNETQAIRPDTVKHLHQHIAQIQHQEVENLARLWVREYTLDVGTQQTRRGRLRRSRERLDAAREQPVEKTCRDDDVCPLRGLVEREGPKEGADNAGGGEGEEEVLRGERDGLKGAGGHRCEEKDGVG